MIDWQEQYDGIAFPIWDSHNPCDNAILPIVPIASEPSSLNNAPASDTDDTIFDNLVAYSPNPAPDCVSPRSTTKPSPKDTSPNPGSNSTSKSRAEKRKANTLAARRYRQKRLDRVSELEAALKDTQLERDALKMQLAKLEGETRVLRDLVRSGR